MSRRGENIFKRKDGRWEARYIHHYENGKAKYRYLYGKSYGEVKQKRLTEQKAARPEQPAGVRAWDFQALAQGWLASVRPRVKESTFAQYTRIVTVYLEPAVRRYFFTNQRTSLAEALLQCGGANGGPLSPKTVTDLLCVWKSIVKFGQQSGNFLLQGVETKLPQRGRARASILDEVSRKRLEAVLLSSDTRDSLGIFLALFSGLRIGELCGLQWGDVDFANRTLCVNRTVERIANLDDNALRKTKVILSTPKTGSSRRVIPLPAFAAERLLRFSRPSSAYILTGTKRPMEPHCFYMRYQRFLQRNGFPKMTFHTLRHTFATRCVELGFDAKTLAEILGHSSVTTTMAVYVHPTMQQKRLQMERLAPESCL